VPDRTSSAPPRIRDGAPGPGPGTGVDREPERAAILNARIALVALVVVGQLWALTLVLNSWFRYRDGQMWLLVGFEALSFALALVFVLIGRRR
jgi:hypothetical protein